MNGALWVTQTCLVVPRYSHHAATRREREHQSPRFTFDPPRSSQVRGRRPRISRDLSDRATIVSRGCRSCLVPCLVSPLSVVLCLSLSSSFPLTFFSFLLFLYFSSSFLLFYYFFSLFLFYS